MIDIWKGLPKLREPERFEAWSHRLLVRACYSEEADGVGRQPWACWINEARTPDTTGAVVDRDELERAFRRLSVDHRAVIVLRHYRHLTIDEIAEVLGIAVGTAASRLHYAMRELRAAVEADARPAEGTVVS